LETFLPSADHFADFLQTFRERRIFFVIEKMQFPCYLQKKFQRVDAGERPLNGRQFFGAILVSRHEKEFEYLDESRVYLVAQSVAGLFWEVVAIFIPLLVYCKAMLNDRQNALGGGLLWANSVHS